MTHVQAIGAQQSPPADAWTPVGLYPQARLFRLLRQHGKHALVVLGDERRDLLKDARGLFGPKPHRTFRIGATAYQCWDVEDLDSWDSYHEKVRVVRSVETTTENGRRTQREQISEWVWVTTLSASEVPTPRPILRTKRKRDRRK